MKKNINKSIYLIAISVLFIGTQFSVADESFQNNLLKMDVSQSSLGGVKMTLYTNKPYSENVVVNKKSDTEYVILMPETSNSMTAAPVLNSVAGVVRGVSVKTQQYENNAKGYTKITVSTTKPVEISPQIETLKSEDVKVSQKDYDELLEQVAKQKLAAKAPSVKRQTPPVFKPAKVLEKLRMNAKSPSVPRIAKTKPTYVQKVPKVKKVQIKPAVETKKIVQAIKPVAPVTPVATTTTTSTTAPVSANVGQTMQAQGVQKQSIQPQFLVPTVSNQTVPAFQTLINPPKERKLSKIIRIIKNNLYIFMGAAAALFILLLMGARGMVKNINRQKEIFTSNLEEQPSVVTDYEEKINEDMTWKEKFQTYTEASQQDISKSMGEEKSTANPTLDDLFSDKASSESAQEDIEDLFDEESTEEEIYDEVGEEYVENLGNNQNSALDEFDNVAYDKEYEDEDDFSLDELFGEEEVQSESEKAEEIESLSTGELFVGGGVISQVADAERDELVKSEYIIDDEKGFYLVDFEEASALVGHIEDEIFVLKRFEQRMNDKLQARLNETKGNSSNYMTRVGNFKGLVEVTPDKMNLLIEL